VLHKEIPFLRICIPFCSGIICGLYFNPPNLFFIAALTVVFAAFLISLRFNNELNNIFYGVVLSMTLFITGLMLFTEEKSSISILKNEEAIYTGTLENYPEEKENSWKIVIKLEKGIVNNKEASIKGSMLIYYRKSSKSPLFLPGDQIKVRCTPEAITSRGNPYEFDYRSYMERQGIRYFAFADSTDVSATEPPGHRHLRDKALIVRNRIIQMFSERGVTDHRLALVSAITLGEKSMLDPEQKQYFIKAGVMHIMAVSGLHAVILSLFIFKMLFFLKGRLNILRVLITLAILWSFAFVTGLTPSVLRATLMFSFLQAGSLMKRPVNGINSVLASAFVLILIKPSVIFDAGFLLSYSAVVYIIIFYRDLYSRLQFKGRIPDLIWQSAAVTIIAQAGTLPLTVLLFNRFPTWFILSNIIIVPLSSLVIIIGCLVPLTYPVIFISRPLAVILDKLTGITEFLTEKASSLPFSTIENIGLTTFECIFLTVTIFLATSYLLKRKSMPVLFPLSALLCFILAGTLRDIEIHSGSELIVYNTIGNTTIGIRNGEELNIYSNASELVQEVNKHAASLDLRVIKHDLPEGAFLLKTGKKRMLVTSIVNSSVLEATKPDILIINGRFPALSKNYSIPESFEAVVIAPEVSQGFRKLLQGKIARPDAVHYVGIQGAYSTNL
jgi:competence protein ComEC